MLKRIGKVLLVLAVILGIVWVTGRYGWKLRGFSACGGTMVQSVNVEEGQVSIEGMYPGSFPCGYIGYVAKQEGDTLYFGVRYDPIFGVFELGQFEERIPTQGKVCAVYLRTNTDDYLIWEETEE